jgi:hypothetical protein
MRIIMEHTGSLKKYIPNQHCPECLCPLWGYEDGYQVLRVRVFKIINGQIYIKHRCKEHRKCHAELLLQNVCLSVGFNPIQICPKSGKPVWKEYPDKTRVLQAGKKIIKVKESKIYFYCNQCLELHRLEDVKFS